MTATVAAVADAFSFTRLIAVVACLSTRTSRGCSRCSSRRQRVVVTETASPRRMPVDDLRALADEVFGEDRVHVEDRLDDALDTGIALAEDDAPTGTRRAGHRLGGHRRRGARAARRPVASRSSSSTSPGDSHVAT
jgi:dihydrofolate synthase/folylpolyglutamate synthase